MMLTAMDTKPGETSPVRRLWRLAKIGPSTQRRRLELAVVLATTEGAWRGRKDFD